MSGVVASRGGRSVAADRAAPPTAWWWPLAAAVSFALVIGAVEFGGWLWDRHVEGRLTGLGPHVSIAAPVAYLLLFLPAASALSVMAAVRPNWPVRRLAVFGFGTVLVVSLLLMFIGRLHPVAILVLAMGVGWQLGAHAHKRPASWVRALRASAVVALLFLIAGGAWANRGAHWGRGETAAAGSGPNVLLIILDTVRAASLSLYGYERPTTPGLERLAERAIVFDRAMSTAPWTLPSHASVFTGLYPHQMRADWQAPLEREPRTLAEIFSAAGYRTAGFTANLGFTSRETGIARGFQHYEDHGLKFGEIVAASAIGRFVGENMKLRQILGTDELLERKSAGHVIGGFTDWLDNGDTQRPFFAFLNLYDAHGPYLPPAPYDTAFGAGRADRSISPLHRLLWDPSRGHAPLSEAEHREEVDAYDGAILYLDAQLDSLFAALRRQGLMDNTIVVITADHGEEFGEHRVYDHGNSLYLAGVHVPLLIVPPGGAPGVRVGEAVSLRDLPATLLELAGIDDALPGVSLAPLWNGQQVVTSPVYSRVSHASGHPDWYPVSRGPLESLIEGRYRMIRDSAHAEELYDIVSDVWEQTPRTDSPAAQPLRAGLERMASEPK